MKMDIEMMRNLVSLGYTAKESGLDIEDVVDMIEKGFVAVQPQKQMQLAMF
ncbi:hypothetical protein KJ780_00460 [Candidatus Micrarchaeota archaeon]|nr:hypothetical protein [Candidatus Micrarchaeota archaeon]